MRGLRLCKGLTHPGSQSVSNAPTLPPKNNPTSQPGWLLLLLSWQLCLVVRVFGPLLVRGLILLCWAHTCKMGPLRGLVRLMRIMEEMVLEVLVQGIVMEVKKTQEEDGGDKKSESDEGIKWKWRRQ